MPSPLVTAAVLVAAGLAPVAAAPEFSTPSLTQLSAEVMLAGNAIVDGFDSLAGLTAADVSVAETIDLPELAEAFEISLPADAFDVSVPVGAFDIPGSAEAFDVPGSAAAFDLVGLFNAEVAAAIGLFNRMISLPSTLFYDFQAVFNSLLSLNFGMAFSEAVSIPLDIFNYVWGIPGAVLNTAFQMLVVIPGEYLFNFG
ncbi:hypothetical protein [Mycolicibacter minnesotensis]